MALFGCSCRMCVPYPLHPSPDPLFYLTEVLLPPLLFGVGVLGSLLVLAVLNCRTLRRESSIYVYLTGLAAADVLSLACAVPRFIRNVDAFPIELAFSREMAFAVWVKRGLGPVCVQSAAWMAALTGVVRYAGVQFQSSPSRWTRISLSRVVVFVVFVFCLLLNFTRFLDTEVVELSGHCFEPLTLWSQNVTRFGLNPVYRDLHPVIVSFLGYLIPLSVTLLFVLLVGCGPNGCSLLGRRSVLLRTPRDRDEGEFQVNISVLAICTALLVLGAPLAVCSVFDAFFKDALDETFVYYFEMVARCLWLLRSALGFVLLALINYDFRKTLRRGCCCCCPAQDDEFFEPVTCCPCRRRADRDGEAFSRGKPRGKFRSVETRQTKGTMNGALNLGEPVFVDSGGEPGFTKTVEPALTRTWEPAFIMSREPAVNNVYDDVSPTATDQQRVYSTADECSGFWI